MLRSLREGDLVLMLGTTRTQCMSDTSCMVQDLVVYCNATQNQFYGDSGVNYNTGVFAEANPSTTDNAINCCLRCAFSNSCNIW